MYLVILHHDNKLYLQCVSSKDEPHTYFIYGAELEEAVAQFDSFAVSIKSGSLESYMSSGLGLATLRPLAVRWDGPADDIKPFLVSTNVYSGFSGMGYRVTSPSMQVKPSFLDGRETVDICIAVVNRAYDEMVYKTEKM